MAFCPRSDPCAAHCPRAGTGILVITFNGSAACRLGQSAPALLGGRDPFVLLGALSSPNNAAPTSLDLHHPHHPRILSDPGRKACSPRAGDYRHSNGESSFSKPLKRDGYGFRTAGLGVWRDPRACALGPNHVFSLKSIRSAGSRRPLSGRGVVWVLPHSHSPSLTPPTPTSLWLDGSRTTHSPCLQGPDPHTFCFVSFP